MSSKYPISQVLLILAILISLYQRNMKVLDLLWYKDANKMKRVVQKLSLPLYALQILMKKIDWLGANVIRKRMIYHAPRQILQSISKS